MSKIKLALAVLAGVLADGTTANTLTVQVTNDAGGVLSGQAVTLTGDNGVVFSRTALTTDDNGAATTDLTSTIAGTYQVTATLADGTAQSISVEFLAVPVAASNVVPVAATTSALDALKADFEKEVEWILHGIEVFGEAAEADLVALRNKFR
ncbi:Ig-like domain-containing protein [Candidatus Pantoea multigeneris]|uniref:Ig domain-containing protein group 1 domain-containing protein n=1 Tax=Candidatus Pantoea multigeneris TaxID=2608357 RepID=A0ABX0R7P0_9GAMM|nr:Ig-like domain-containing protein [Pantoea multigeneris]NIF20276.1 Ig domain-containing protein group 1 domain-containing protein [Pantoea multigeneris]